jgi:hypothetical protein
MAGASSPRAHPLFPISKRSEWIGQYNRRLATVRPPWRDGWPATLVWQGGADPGSIPLDSATDVRVEGDQLVLRRKRRELRFRAASAGPTVHEWFARIGELRSATLEAASTALAGELAKKSRWVGRWNVRSAAVLLPTGAGAATLVWRGGGKPGLSP